MTPLHKAAKYGYVGVVNQLLRYKNPVDFNLGWDRTLNGKDPRSRLPIHMAAFYCRELVVKVMLAHDPLLVNACDAQNWTPLHYACAGGAVRVVEELLLSPNIELGVKTTTSLTPLQMAANYKMGTIVQLLHARMERDGNERQQGRLTEAESVEGAGTTSVQQETIGATDSLSLSIQQK
jgi:ankyrin repeat protein